MIRYNVRSRYLVDLINEVREEKLILAPFFQRKLVWRLAHKVDFIKTILCGYPFPEIFVARGDIDLDSMQSTSALVDGQQRMTTIKEFLEDKFSVDGMKYSDLAPSEKEAFLKYEIAIIDLDLQQHDEQIIEIFKRLNRTFYALSSIEKLSTEFRSSEFMLTAKLLSGELRDEPDSDEAVAADRHEYDPSITPEFIKWGQLQKVQSFIKLALESTIFTKQEISRQVHLMFTLNVMATILDGYYNRNESATRYLNSKVNEFPEKSIIVQTIEESSIIFNKLRFKGDSFWYSKSNAFTLLITLCQNRAFLASVKLNELREKLNYFAENAPPDYTLAAKEGVNNKKERLTRASYVDVIFNSSLP